MAEKQVASQNCHPRGIVRPSGSAECDPPQESRAIDAGTIGGNPAFLCPKQMHAFFKGVAVWFCGTILSWAAPPPEYYSPASGQTGGPLKQALHGIISNHTVVPYNSLIAPLTDIWRDPANPSNILLIYSHTSVSSGSSWNREHLWPRSRGNSDQAGPDDSDLFHVVPSDISVNAERGSLYFDESDPGDPFYSLPGHSLAPQTSRDSDSWQPPQQERGDIARALFYLDVRYDGQDPLTTDLELVSFPPAGSQMGRLNTLLLWHEQDPPDDAERARNDLIFNNYQNNRNPFIDHPEWVAEIWGTGTPGGGGSRPIARAGVVSASAVEQPTTAASFLVSLNQFAPVGGITVDFTMVGAAATDEFTLSGAGVVYDSATGAGSVIIPENFSSVLVMLTPLNDATEEPAESAVATLTPGAAYTVVPDSSSSATLTITDAPGLPASWNFNSGIPYANPLPANSGTGTISFSGWLGTINSFTGSSGLGLALVGNAGNGSWIDIHLSMVGYTGLNLSFATRGTATGYDTGTWSASVDGVNFTTLAGVNTATRSTTFIQRQVSFSTLAMLTDAPNVTLRYTLSGAANSTSNNRIDELVATATPIVTGDALRTVSIAAVDATANEATLDPGTFAVQLNGFAPPGGLDVELFFGSGSATAPELPGGDYTLAGLTSYDPVTRIGHLFFLEGQSTALVTVTPVSDLELEYAETVIASIVTSPAYLLGAGSSGIVTILSPLANDAFADAVPLNGTVAAVTGSNVGATRETGEPWHHGSTQTGGRSVWWQWTAPADGVVEIRTIGSNFDTLLGLYTGASVSSQTRIGVDDDGGGGLTSLLTVRVTQAVTYFIAVDGYGQSAGQITLSLVHTPVPVVAISVVNALAKERGSIPGVVRFTLSNASPLPVTIALSYGGSATPGSDYTGSIPNLTIQAGVITVDLNLVPIPDLNVIEQNETVSVTVLAGSAYQVDPAPQDSVSLTLEDDSPYSGSWIAGHPGLTPESAAPLADDDLDGIPTLLEYLADRDPSAPDGASLLTVDLQPLIDPADGLEKTFAVIRCIRRQDAAGIPLVVEGSNTLEAGSWEPRGVFISATPLAGTGREELLYRSSAPIVESAAYFRLRATTP